MSRENFFLLLDAARMGADIITAKELNKEFDSLYRGKSEVHLSAVAPYLFSMEHNTQFEDWYMQNGWGNSWGVMVFSDRDLSSLVKHFRHFLMVMTEDKEELYFRFYDPRVLRIFLPTCDEDQLNEFFGPVDYYVCEDEDPASALVFSLKDGELKTERILRENLISFNPPPRKRRFSLF
jgi:hypothetical protein